MNTNEILDRLEKLANESPTVSFQGDTESDRFYSAANPQTIIHLISALKELQKERDLYRNQLELIKRAVGAL